MLNHHLATEKQEDLIIKSQTDQKIEYISNNDKIDTIEKIIDEIREAYPDATDQQIFDELAELYEGASESFSDFIPQSKLKYKATD